MKSEQVPHHNHNKDPLTIAQNASQPPHSAPRLLTTTGVIAAPAPAPAPSNNASSAEEIIFLGVHSFNETRTPEEIAERDAFLASKANSTNALGKRDTCGGFGNNGGIYKPDITALGNSLQNDNPWGMTSVPAWAGWYVGNALVCVYNDYWFENTHVSRWEAGWGTKYIRNMCGYNGEGWTR
ncbi:hypothetical protein QBC44DRAFT_365228 [Cladorrhinum sp. PSN332]|nr:hypothetical protein QBC44DRAFT_365228 [Cladorrhinum sp. PSN332]